MPPENPIRVYSVSPVALNYLPICLGIYNAPIRALTRHQITERVQYNLRKPSALYCKLSCSSGVLRGGW